MSAVVTVCGQSFTVGAKVGVMTHGAFVSITHDAGKIVFVGAQRSIAVYTMVALQALRNIGDNFKQWDEAMPWMFDRSRLDTSGAVIPVRAVHTFMAHAMDGLFHRLETCMDVVWIKDTLSQLSQNAKWRILRPGAQRLVANVSSVVFLEAGSRLWPG